jgi:hypothetical protein
MSRHSSKDDDNNIDSDYEFHEDAGEDACFDLCTKKSSCGGYLSDYTWKSKFNRVIGCLGCCSIFLLFIGAVFPLILYNIVDQGINDSVIIDSESATSYKTWQSNYYNRDDDTVDINYDVYLFDVQNIPGLLSGQKPILVERGPYAYKEYFNKFDISWSDGGNEVTYTNQKFFVFNPERTGVGLTEHDNITLPYTSVIGFQYLLQQIPYSQQEFFRMTVTALIDAKLGNITAAIEEQIAAIENLPFIPATLQETLAKLKSLDAAIKQLNYVSIMYNTLFN